ncbi:MAG: DUF433 domain-containing protein [Planctomycetaceae bacterium]|nr:DUF433 domain-containing protein [Planctomycetaceae bacterium]
MGRTSRSAAVGGGTVGPPSASSKTPRVRPPQSTARQEKPGESQDGPVVTFDAFVEALRDELAPSGLLETLVADRAILSAWRLHAASQAEVAALRKSSAKPSSQRTPRPLPEEARHSLSHHESSLERSLALLQTLRDRRRPCWGQPAPLASASVLHELDDPTGDSIVPRSLDELPTIPPNTFDDDDVSPENAETGSDERWQERLVFENDISESSPVIKGTWITVDQVVSLVIDGWTWSDILRAHPELTEADIRCCLAYTSEQAERSGDP